MKDRQSTPFQCISSNMFNRVAKGDTVTSSIIYFILLGEERGQGFGEMIVLVCVICQVDHLRATCACIETDPSEDNGCPLLPKQHILCSLLKR